jgi:hypothetical protein
MSEQADSMPRSPAFKSVNPRQLKKMVAASTLWRLLRCVMLHNLAFKNCVNSAFVFAQIRSLVLGRRRKSLHGSDSLAHKLSKRSHPETLR